MRVAFLDWLLKEIRTLPEPARQAVAAHGVTLEVISASPLDPADEEHYRELIGEAFGSHPQIAFKVGSSAIAGLELHGPHLVVSNSWRADLTQIFADLTHDHRPLTPEQTPGSNAHAQSLAPPRSDRRPNRSAGSRRSGTASHWSPDCPMSGSMSCCASTRDSSALPRCSNATGSAAFCWTTLMRSRPVIRCAAQATWCACRWDRRCSAGSSIHLVARSTGRGPRGRHARTHRAPGASHH